LKGKREGDNNPLRRTMSQLNPSVCYRKVGRVKQRGKVRIAYNSKGVRQIAREPTKID